MAEKFREIRCPIPGAKAYYQGYLQVIVSRDLIGGSRKWHLSISHPHRHPIWDEIKEARYQLLPDAITMGILLPPKGEYVNIHEHCFHLFEVDVEWQPGKSGRPEPVDGDG